MDLDSSRKVDSALETQPTVAGSKHAFLDQQKRILSKGIQPSRRLYQIADRAHIQSEVVTDVVQRVNQNLNKHSKLVYSRQMTVHVAEQIDQLYWDAGTSHDDLGFDSAMDIGIDDNMLYGGDDLTLDKNISKLPSTWDTSADGQHNNSLERGVDEDGYLLARARLEDLSGKRLTLQQKLSTYQALLSLLEPYRHPKETVQPNLIYRDAPLEAELKKTRTLAIRVAGRIGEKFEDVQVPTTAEDEDSDLEMANDDSNTKLGKVLSQW